MLILILFLVVGSLLAYLSRYNLTPVSVNVAFTVIPDVPLFYVIIVSFVLGLSLAYVVQLVHSITNQLVLRGKEHEIKKREAEVLELTKRVHQLELHNEKLKRNPRLEPVDNKAL